MKTIWNINTSLPVEFAVKITKSLLDVENNSLLEIGDSGPNARRLVLVDSEVFWAHSSKIKNYFLHHNITAKIIPIDVQEETKELETLLFILKTIENFAILRRSEPLICIGGGVLLDIGGLAASLYRRGIPYIKVDASVGVKTSINHFGRRNRLGSYYAPVAAYLDKTFLKTLPEKEIIYAMGEILKMAVIKNEHLFDLMEDNIEVHIADKFLSDGKSDDIISISINDMIEELEPNLWEKDLKRLVDFGHSFSPLAEMNSLEDDTVKTLAHGEAVALDVIFSSCLSYHRKILSHKDLKRIISLAKRMKMEVYHASFSDPMLMWEGLQDTMKHRNNDQNLPVPVTLGKSVFLNDVTFDDLTKTTKIYVQETK